MKKTILTLLVLSLVCCATAQQHQNKKQGEKVAIGLKVGGNLPNYHYTANPELNALGYDSLPTRLRPEFGLMVEVPLFDGAMYVSPEVVFAQRGDSRLFQSTTYNGLVRYQAKVNYLEARLPISVAYPVSRGFKPYVFAAPSFSLALPTVEPMESEIQHYSFDNPPTLYEKVPVDSSNMAPYDYGLTLGAGMRFKINFTSFSMIVKLEGGYYWGFKNTYSDQEINHQATAVNLNPYSGTQYVIDGNRLNRGVQASLGIAIPLEFHSSEDCFYWSDMNKRKNRNRGLYGF